MNPPIHTKEDIEKCGIPSIEQMTHVLRNCPNSDGLKCSGKEGKYNQYDKWKFCHSSWKDIAFCPPLSKEKRDMLMMDDNHAGTCFGVYCRNGEWKGECLYVSVL